MGIIIGVDHPADRQTGNGFLPALNQRRKLSSGPKFFSGPTFFSGPQLVSLICYPNSNVVSGERTAKIWVACQSKLKSTVNAMNANNCRQGIENHS